MREQIFDVVVAGSGSAGLTAAVTAAKRGLSVVLVEKSGHFGGTSAWSGGGCWIPDNPLLANIELSDSRAEAERYVRSVVGPSLREELLAAFLDHGREMIEFLTTNTEVVFFARKPAPDYHMEAPGAKIGGRSLASPLYDSRRLGENLKRLALPLRSFNAPWGMMISPLDLMHARQVFRSWTSFVYMAKIAGRYAWDRVRYGRGTRIAMGNALVARLLRSAMDAGVILWTDTPAVNLERDGTRVTGLVVRRDGRALTLKARRGVVLATGGFAGDPQMRAAHFPYPNQHETMIPDTNVGDGLKMAQAVGAILETQNAQAGAWSPVSKLVLKPGKVLRAMHFFTDLPKPGSIIVNQSGERFVDEAALHVAHAMHATDSVPAWIVCDRAFLLNYGVGLVYPHGLNIGAMRRAGYLIEAPSLVGLAQKIDVDAAALERTVSRFNGFAATGIDEDFGRGKSALDLSMGDHHHKPNPCLGPISTAPFYAVQIVPGDAGSVLGLRVNAKALAIDADGAPIPGLYVCGLDMNSLWMGNGVANGMNHAHNMTFAYIAALDMASVDSARPSTHAPVPAAHP